MSNARSVHGHWAITKFGKAKNIITHRTKGATTQGITKEGVATKNPKSCAQVAILVGRPESAPPKSCGLKPKHKRESALKVRLNETQREEVRAKAKKAHMSVNAFIKDTILDRNYDPHVRTLLLRVNRELTAQGNNLNQIAKQLNSGTATPSQGVAMLEAIRDPLVRALYAVRNALTLGTPKP